MSKKNIYTHRILIVFFKEDTRCWKTIYLRNNNEYWECVDGLLMVYTELSHGEKETTCFPLNDIEYFEEYFRTIDKEKK